MWFAVAIIGMIGIAFGISTAPGGMPGASSPPAAAAPAQPPPSGPTPQH